MKLLQLNEEEWGPRDYSKELKPKPVPHQLSWKDWGQYQKDQAIVRQTRQDIPKIFGKELLPEPDLVEVIEMLAAGEIGVDEAYEVGLSVEEIEDILGRPLTNIELESIEDVDENY